MLFKRTRVLDLLRAAACGLLAAAALAVCTSVAAQSEDGLLPFTPDELEELVAPIALYPDDLLAVVLPASTYPLDVVDAARLLDQLENGSPRVPDEDWDDSIVALLNYPEVLRLMDEDLDWTWDLGEAFLSQQAEVLDAIQRFRLQARQAGTLKSDDRQLVNDGEGTIHIVPADPQVIYVPYYEPRQVILHAAPIHYYPQPYPVYYYPYPSGYSFSSGYFWGVTTAFVIGWHTHHLHAHPRLHVGHPYHRYAYYDPFYVRRSISINVVNVDRNVYVWQPRLRRIGARPGRVTITREGAVRADYGSRRTVTRAVERQRPIDSVRSAASRERTIGGIAQERRGIAQERRRITSSGRQTTAREGVVVGLREARERTDASTSARSSRSSGTIGAVAPARESRRSSAPAPARQTSRATPAPYSSRAPTRQSSRPLAPQSSRAPIDRTRTGAGRESGRSSVAAPSRALPRSNVAGTSRSTRPAASARSGTPSRNAATAAPRASEGRVRASSR